MAVLVAISVPADAALTFTVGGSWPNEAHRTAAVNAMQAVVDRYNAYGDFGNDDIYVYYNAGIPTAQASYLGSIGFGGTYPNERVTQHETAHYLGSGTVSQWGSLMTGGSWDGPQATALVQEFDGLEEYLHGDSQHFWPYGLNYDSEGSEINKQRQVAMIYAQRADMGLGPTAHPSTATSVTLAASDPYGESGFNYKTRWSDGYFPHAGAAYSTGAYAMRTPESTNSFTFAGDSLTLSNPAVDTGLYFKGLGTTGVITFNNLILDGGWVDHRSTNGLADLFQLDGTVTVNSPSTIRAYNGNINILADVTGSGDLTIPTTSNPTENNRYVRFLSSNSTFTGDIINQSRFELAESANFTFTVGAPGVNNAIAGATAQNTLLNGAFDLDLTGASTNPGDSWALVTAANATYGPIFSVAGFTESNNVWSDGEYEFSEATGLLTVLPPPSTWNVDGGGSWSNAANWTGGVPPADGRATLGSMLTADNAPAAINLDVPVSLRKLTFDNPHRYVLSGANTLTLTGAAEIVANSGSHEIAIPVAGISGLTLSGGGAVTLSAANSYSGDTRINAGTLSLGGTATIANTPHIDVAAGGTLDVSGVAGGSYALNNQTLTIDGDVVGNIVAANNSTVHVNSADSMHGNLSVQTSSLVTGAGRITGNLAATSDAVVRVGGEGLAFHNSRLVVDDFESYATGHVRDVASPPWTAHGGSPGTQFADIEADGRNRVLTYGWSGDSRGTSRDMPGDAVIDNDQVATFFFRFNSKTDDPDHNFGLADQVDTAADANFNDFEAQVRVSDNPSATGTFMLDARNGGGFSAPLATGLAPNAWYNVWMVVDQTTDTYNVYMNTGTADATAANRLNTAPLAFRNGTSAPLSKILGLAGAASIDYGVRYDDLIYLTGVDLRNPLGSTPPTFLGESQTLSVEGDVMLDVGAVLELDIVTPTILDLLDVGGHLGAAGTLSVTLVDGAPPPALGDAFQILGFGTASGAFDAFNLPELASGLTWQTSDLLTTGILEVIAAGVIGDYNADGTVDAADYTVWRDHFSADGSLLLNRDPANTGSISEADFVAWKSHFGMTNGSGAGAATAVPEPGTLLFALLAFGGGAPFACRRRPGRP